MGGPRSGPGRREMLGFPRVDSAEQAEGKTPRARGREGYMVAAAISKAEAAPKRAIRFEEGVAEAPRFGAQRADDLTLSVILGTKSVE